MSFDTYYYDSDEQERRDERDRLDKIRKLEFKRFKPYGEKLRYLCCSECEEITVYNTGQCKKLYFKNDVKLNTEEEYEDGRHRHWFHGYCNRSVCDDVQKVVKRILYDYCKKHPKKDTICCLDLIPHVDTLINMLTFGDFTFKYEIRNYKFARDKALMIRYILSKGALSPKLY